MESQNEDRTYNWNLTARQSEALEVLEDDTVSDLLYGGAKGGGKSWFLCQWVFLHCYQLIEDLGIHGQQEHPVPVGFVGRKRGIDFTKTTLETWKKCIPGHLYRIREQQKEIVIDNRVKLYFGGMDDEKNINKFNSAEFAFIAIDQAEEITRTDLALLKGTLRLTANADNETRKQIRYKTLLTANPAPCFLRSDYIESPPKDGSKVFIQALPADNKYLPDSYVQTLKDAFKHRPELVEAYVNGSWDLLEGADILIKHKWCMDAVDNIVHMNEDRRVTVCDVARLGNDETVIYNMVDNKIVGELIYGAKSTDYTVDRIIDMAYEHSADVIACDECGMGGSVVDMLRKRYRDTSVEMTVLGINSAARPTTQRGDKRYLNQRAEMWFYAADRLAEGVCSIPDDPVLIGQLTSVKYTPNGAQGKLQIEKKIDTKKRMEGSPDRADAFIYGLWATRLVAKSKYDFQRQEVQPVAQDSYGWTNVHSEEQTSWSY